MKLTTVFFRKCSFGITVLDKSNNSVCVCVGGMMRFLFCFLCFLAATLTTDYRRHADIRSILALFPKHSVRVILNFLNLAFLFVFSPIYVKEELF